MDHVAVMGNLPQSIVNIGKVTLGYRFKVGSVFLASVGIVALGVLCTMYFLQINAIAKKGMAINQLEQQLSGLEKSSKDITTEIAKIKALSFTEQVVQEHAPELDEISAIRHLAPVSNIQVAKN